MAKEIYLRREGYKLCADDQEAVEFIQSMKVGQGCKVIASKPRNLGFHRKFFKLIDTAFELWDVPEHNKMLKTFRADITVLCGHSDVTIKLNGDLRRVPKSISFASMSQEDFEALYSKAIDVILEHVLTNYKREDLDRAIKTVMEFA